jgi:lipopolysaccharide transport system permease protein
LVDFSLAFLVLIIMMFAFDYAPTSNIIWLPFFLLLAMMTALGTSLWLSAMNVQFRDVRYAIPFLIQLWMFITPVIYPSSVLEEPWRTLYAINPMVGVIEGFRWALLGTVEAPDLKIVISVLSATALLISGAYYFRRMEKTFADVI